MEWMAAFLMFTKKFQVVVVHITSFLTDDLINGIKGGAVFGSNGGKSFFNVFSSLLAVGCFAPLKDLGEHAVDVLGTRVI